MTIDFGYPLGDNVLKPPLEPASVRQLAGRIGLNDAEHVIEFYLTCGGLSLPDVHNGYFVHELPSIISRLDKGEPSSLKGPLGGSIVILGSDGGGSRFAFRTQQQDLLYLPSNGAVRSNIYEGESVDVRIVSEDFTCFLRRLLSDLEAFVRDTQGHTFMV